jgi:hypothetical protein
MYELFTITERRLSEQAPGPDRPIVGEATGDAFSFRLTTFLLQPLLVAEKLGSNAAILTLASYTDEETPAQEREQWIAGLSHLGRLWSAVLPENLAHA